MLSMIENRTEILPVWIFENGQSTWLNSRIQGQMVPILHCVLIPTTKVWPYSWWDSVPHHNSTQVLFLFLYAPVNFVLSLQSLSPIRLFATPWTAACQASLSITNSLSSPKAISIEPVMPSSHLILCCPLLLLSSIFPSIRVFSNKSALHIR